MGFLNNNITEADKLWLCMNICTYTSKTFASRSAFLSILKLKSGFDHHNERVITLSDLCLTCCPPPGWHWLLRITKNNQLVSYIVISAKGGKEGAYLRLLLFTLLSPSSYKFSPWEQSLLWKAQLVQMMGAKNILMISYRWQTGNESEVLRQKWGTEEKNLPHRGLY